MAHSIYPGLEDAIAVSSASEDLKAYQLAELSEHKWGMVYGIPCFDEFDRPQEMGCTTCHDGGGCRVRSKLAREYSVPYR